MTQTMHGTAQCPTTTAPIHFEFKYVVAKLILNLMRAIFNRRFDRSPHHFGAELDGIMIALAVVIGHYEGRPMSAYKISEYLAIPRRTVQRKLAELTELGYITKVCNQYLINLDVLPDDAAERTHTHAEFQMIEAACRKLSEMRAKMPQD